MLTWSRICFLKLINIFQLLLIHAWCLYASFSYRNLDKIRLAIIIVMYPILAFIFLLLLQLNMMQIAFLQTSKIVDLIFKMYNFKLLKFIEYSRLKIVYEKQSRWLPITIKHYIFGQTNPVRRQHDSSPYYLVLMAIVPLFVGTHICFHARNKMSNHSDFWEPKVPFQRIMVPMSLSRCFSHFSNIPCYSN